MFLIKPYKLSPSLTGKTSRKSTKTALAVCWMPITFQSFRKKLCGLDAMQTLGTPTHSKLKMSYAIIYGYSLEYFHPKVGRKIRIFSLTRKNNIRKRVLYSVFQVSSPYQRKLSQPKNTIRHTKMRSPLCRQPGLRRVWKIAYVGLREG